MPGALTGLPSASKTGLRFASYCWTLPDGEQVTFRPKDRVASLPRARVTVMPPPIDASSCALIPTPMTSNDVPTDAPTEPDSEYDPEVVSLTASAVSVVSAKNPPSAVQTYVLTRSRREKPSPVVLPAVSRPLPGAVSPPIAVPRTRPARSAVGSGVPVSVETVSK